jgi:hypothetical protein
MSIADTGRFWEILVIPGTAFLWLTPSFQHRSSKSCITFVYSEGGMDRQGYASPFSCPLLLPLLFSPSSCPSSPFPGPFLLISLYPVHSLSEIPLNCHRNVYVKLTPQSDQPLKTIRIFWSHRWMVYRSFSLYIIYWRCAYCLELVFGRVFKILSCWT